LLVVLALVSLTSAAHITLKWDDPSYLYTRVNAGDTVTWVTQENRPHTITSTDDSHELDSDKITTYPSQSFSHTFTKVGNFHYTSKENPEGMLGTIVVSQIDLSGGVESISGLFVAGLIAVLLAFVIS